MGGEYIMDRYTDLNFSEEEQAEYLSSWEEYYKQKGEENELH